MARIARTVIVRSVKLPRKAFRVFAELEGMYCNIVEQLTIFAVRSNAKSFTRLKALKYREGGNASLLLVAAGLFPLSGGCFESKPFDCCCEPQSW
ncbi:MAG: hypothetical protein QXT53_05435 [Ignisphaera sp.]